MKINCLILSAVLLFVKFSALNCFEIDIVRERDKSSDSSNCRA